MLSTLLALALVAQAPAAEVRDPLGLRAISLQTLAGPESTLAEIVPGFARDELVVLCYTEVGCPISQKLAGRLSRLSRAWEQRGVRFLGIDASAQDSREDVAREAAELERAFGVVKDVRQELTRTLDAQTSTEVFLFDKLGELRYRGAVDDQFTIGAARPEPTRRFLEEALTAVVAGHEPETTSTAAPGCKLTRLPERDLPEAVTWSGEIAALIQNRCEPCHRPGQVGPFPLQTFEQVQGRAKMLAHVVDEGLMPPWNADERYDGVFANERRLAPAEKEHFLAWVRDGMPRGNPSEDPAPIEWPEGWKIGEPDVVFAMERHVGQRGAETELPPEGFAVPREGVVDYEYFVTDTSYPEDRWIQSYQVVPGAADVVHHVVIVALEEGQSLRSIDGSSFLAAYAPGDTPASFPDGYAKRLPAGTRLVFQLHYTPNGKQRFDRSQVGFVFAPEPPIFEVLTDAVADESIVIPAGAENHEVRARKVFREDLGLVALFPHMHTRGKDFRYVAHYPDGAEEELLFAHFDFNWQESYVLPDPLLLPAGTTLECIAHYDNSSANPNNPDPTIDVRWGDQSFEEMFIGYYDHVVPVE
jgi:hypothetical protein